MIQRIQTIFLLLTAILMAVTSFSPLLVIRMPDTALLDFTSCGILSENGGLLKPTWGVICMAAIGSFFAFVNIFLYKKRKIQIRMGYMTSFFIVLFYLALGSYFYFFCNNSGAELSCIHYGAVLPFVALLLNILAIARIKKDDKLVKSLDRIR